MRAATLSLGARREANTWQEARHDGRSQSSIHKPRQTKEELQKVLSSEPDWVFLRGYFMSMQFFNDGFTVRIDFCQR